MTPTLTNWRDRVVETDALVNGRRQPVWVKTGDTAPVGLDVADYLDAGEVPTDVASTLTQLPAVGETDYAEVAAKLSGVPTFSGTVIAQRFQNLEPGRVYRWAVEFGAPDNRRGPTLLVGCVEGA